VPTDMKLPEVGEGIEAGTVVAVLVKEGDRVEVDQPVIELETDKAVVEVPSTVAGVVRKIHVKANAEARVGEALLTVDEGGEPGGAEAVVRPLARGVVRALRDDLALELDGVAAPVRHGRLTLDDPA